MPAFAPLTLNDGQATPIAHVFTPVNIDAGGIAKWADKSSGIPVGYPILTKLVKMPAPKGAQNAKVSVKFALPTLEVTSPSTASGIQPAPTVAYTNYGTVEFVMPLRGTRLNRSDVFAFMKNLFANANFVAAVLDLDAEY